MNNTTIGSGVIDHPDMVLINKKDLHNKILKAVEAMESAANETKDITIFKSLTVGFESLKDLINY